MATRKIRLTMSGTIVNDTGPIVDIDFNGENQDADLEITAANGVSTVVKEYTVDVAAGTYNLDINFKNDSSDGYVNDRNLIIEHIEISNNGVDFESVVVNTTNSNLTEVVNYQPMVYQDQINSSYDPTQPKSESNFKFIQNPDYDATQPRTDDIDAGWFPTQHPGNNPMRLYTIEINPITIFVNGTTTFNITFS